MLKKRLLIGLCSWNNPALLSICVKSLVESIDLSKDGIAVVLNQADRHSQDILNELKIPFVSLPENRGVLAIDYLTPFIENSEYFLNTNDDMIFHKGFCENLISIIQEFYPASSSCRLVENFYSNNPCVTVDQSLSDIYNEETRTSFLNNITTNAYGIQKKVISYNHPICVKSSDYLAVGGYSGGWDLDYLSGYGRDDAFAYSLWDLHNTKFSFVCSDSSFVFHASSETMKRLPSDIKNQHNRDTFRSKNKISIEEFRRLIGYGSLV